MIQSGSFTGEKAMLTATADIVVRALDGRIVATVMVKNLPSLKLDAAVAIKDAWLESGLILPTAHFLLLSQEHGYLWLPGHAQTGQRPDLILSMAPIVARTFPRLPARERLHGSVLEMIVAEWLRDLAIENMSLHGDPERKLVKAGFVRDIENAVIETDNRV
jgi:hypothetical protein